MLGYAGSLIGACATIGAVLITIKKGEDQRKEDLRLGVLPCIAMRSLEKVNRKSFLDFEFCDSEEEDEDVSSPAAKKGPYKEIDFEKEYAVYSADGFGYKAGLTDDQRNKIEWRTLPVRVAEGVAFDAANPSYYVPLVFSSVGNGAAINCSISIVKADSIYGVPLKGLTACSIRQMPCGAERYLGIYFDDATCDECHGKYQIIVNYEDTYGNRYVQAFELEIGVGENRKGVCFSMAIDRYRRHGDKIEA